MTLLHIDSSILNEQSVSRQLTAAIVKHLSVAEPDARIIHTDLAADPINHLSSAEFLALQGVEPQDEHVKQAVARNAKLVDDFLAADVIIVGAPMYNFTLPTQLRAWLDRLAVPGRTFRYTENGAEGLAKGKRVIVASTRGGLYGEGTPLAFLGPSGNLSAQFLRLPWHYGHHLHSSRGTGTQPGKPHCRHRCGGGSD